MRNRPPKLTDQQVRQQLADHEHRLGLLEEQLEQITFQLRQLRPSRIHEAQIARVRDDLAALRREIKGTHKETT